MKRTFRSCYIGTFVMALVTNLSPLLFVTFMGQFSLNFEQVGRLALVNFFTQVIVTLSFSRFVDKHGVRPFVTAGHMLVFAGFVLFAFTDTVFPFHPYSGIIVATILFSIGGGLLELLLSAIVQAIPTDTKASDMSMMHAFYALGMIVVVGGTTAMIAFMGSTKWPLIILLWSIIPLLNFFNFLRVPLAPAVAEKHRTPTPVLLKSRYLLLVIVGMALAGSSEIAMTQWTSAYAEAALGLSKTTGDLLGLSLFAALLGVGRLAYGRLGRRLDLWSVMLGGSLFAAICYLVASLATNPIISLIACAATGFGVALLWPGSIVLATTHFPRAGSSLFALLAAGGTIGAAIGPWALGFVADLVPPQAPFSPLRTAMLVGTIFPLLMATVLLILRKMDAHDAVEQQYRQ
ncbi:MAG: MFS transporter [Sphaerochaetaceae bacterium]